MKGKKNKKRDKKEADREIEAAIGELIGNDIIPIVRELKNKKNVSEFRLAEKLRLEINDIRNMIYKLDSYGLVSSTRKKDKRKGWYIYYWTFNEKNAVNAMIAAKQKELNKAMEELRLEKKNIYFVCPNKCNRIDIESAMESQYICRECGSLMTQEDSTKKIRYLNKKIEGLENDLLRLKELAKYYFK